jgi:hypothetical protein
MSVLSWLKKLRGRKGEPSPDSATSDAAHEADARKADIGGTLFVRGSAHSEAERLSSDD